jgi:cyanophycin synthetase
MRLRLKLPLDAIGDLALVDAWLTNRFSIDLEKQRVVDAVTKEEAEGPARAAIDRALLIYGEIARAANLPCFDRGHLVSLELVPEDAGRVVAVVALPVVDNVATNTLINLFGAAVRTVGDCSRISPEDDAGDSILARLEKTIAELAKIYPFLEMTVPICRIARDHGIPFRHLGSGYMRFGIGSEGDLVQYSSVQRDSAVGANICMDKRITALMLRAAGLPGAEHISVTSRESASAAARRLGWPVVVKPADREESKGVTAGISDEAPLLAAYDKARAASPNVLVERHVAGTCHRILVAADKVLYVVNRLPKRVEGNGRDNIAALVDVLNARRKSLPPWKSFKPHILDALALECLAADGFTPDSVLAEGQFAYIRPIPSMEWGGDVEDLAQVIHPENRELAIAAARLLGLTVAGIDLMTTDITQPWHATGAIINEMNFRPRFSDEKRKMDPSILVGALVRGSGRVPVHLITGSGDLDSAVSNLQRRLSKSGPGCHSTSATTTRGPDGSELSIAASTLFERTLALTLRTDVHGIIVAGPPDELFATGLAVDRLDSLTVIDTDTDRANRLLGELQAHFVAQSASISAR